MANFGTFTASTALLAADLNKIGGAWTTYTPTYTGITVGNGTVASSYVRIGRTVVYSYRLTLGSTTTIGTDPKVSIPTASATGNEIDGTSVMMYDSSGPTRYFGHLYSASSTTIGLVADTASGTYSTGTAISASIPMTWATGDLIMFCLVYQSSTDPT